MDLLKQLQSLEEAFPKGDWQNVAANLAERSPCKSNENEPNFFRIKANLAEQYLQQGELVQAFQIYRDLSRINSNDEQVRSQLFECLKRLKADHYDSSLENDLLEYLNWEQVNYQDLSSLCESLLSHKYRLLVPDTSLNLETLGKDRFLTRCFSKMFFSSPQMEQLLTLIRRSLLMQTLQNGKMSNPLLKLSYAIAQNSFLNEYCYFINDDEAELLAAVEQAIRENIQIPLEVEPLVCLYAMYLPPFKESWCKTLASNKFRNLSKTALRFVQTVIIPSVQKKNQKVPQHHTIEDATSLAVKEQYEKSPYPRWISLPNLRIVEYRDALRKELPYFEPPQFLKEKPIHILVAGCGTGLHALNVAKYFRNTDVLAIDICETSLRYATEKAREYNITNIQFMQADILRLGDLSQRFHIIESSGVIHHMDDPLAGAQVLKSLLLGGGLLKLGLYSERARKEVVECRDFIQKANISCNGHGIRKLRHEILQHHATQFKQITHSTDFYNMSGCRDLLFHVKEHCYTPLQLKDFCGQLDMEFLGFVRLQNHTKETYDKMFNDDKSRTQLESWDQLEQLAPNTFSSMYQFYLQK